MGEPLSIFRSRIGFSSTHEYDEEAAKNSHCIYSTFRCHTNSEKGTWVSFRVSIWLGSEHSVARHACF